MTAFLKSTVFLLLSFNISQIRPILEFQTQEDPESKEKWLTCVVFPQKEHKSSLEDCKLDLRILRQILKIYC